MKVLTCLVFVGLVIASCSADYTPKQQAFLADIIAKCAVDLKVTLGSDLLERSKSGKNPFPDNEKTKSFVICFMTKTGVLSPDGTIATQKFIDFLAEGHDVKAITDVVQKCAKVEGATPEDKAYNFHKCFWEEKTFEL
ncbi:uncharacterized protein LOC129733198 [Wyeomyia smithii]|uniref:uncharacterized protein LOC129733198 n=1 Tax=Wyeomyia smithii TaxID=174621 RepID=UPI002467B5E5|nr:uncharacterized protein LOC129733198 [Wyeomyia smithii]